MRLCYIANPNSVHTRRWIRHFVERGDQVHLIGEHELHRRVPSGVTFYDLPAQFNARKLRYLAWGRAVRRIVREIQPDLLHAHQVASAGWLGAAAGYHPLVVTAWGSDLLIGPRRSWVHRQLARWVLRRADYVTCVSETLAKVARSLGADPDLLEVAPWGVNLDIFHPAPPNMALRQELDLGSGPVVLSLRAVRAIYNPLDMARAIAGVLEKVPGAKFLIRTYASDPDLLDRFRAIVQENRAAGSVHYVAEQSGDHAIADMNRLADVAVSVPSSDGTPLSVLEVLACGAAVVLSDVPSLHEWVQDGREALFVPVGDVQALSAAIVRLLTDDSLRRELSDRGARLVRQRGDSRVWMRHSEGIYRKLVEQGSR